MYNEKINEVLLADMLSVSIATVGKWRKSNKIKPDSDGTYSLENLSDFPQIKEILETKWDEELRVKPTRAYKSIELFAGAGGLAIGLEKAGFKNVALNEIDKDSCRTLRHNKPNWNVIEGDVKDVDFTQFKDIDFLSGGFPCQAFSFAGKKLGFEDTRGTLFFELARAIKETRPKVFLGENVRGLLHHDNGRTLEAIKSVIAELGYTLVKSKVLKAIFYRVPQKRERLFLVAVRNDLVRGTNFKFPDPFRKIMTVRDALKAGELYDTDVPKSVGQTYPERKAEILSKVPEGGHWKNLPDDLQREYMKASYFMGGGKTGMARRLSWDNPSLTLTCAPAQKQTERCHPKDTRPLTVREYARIQTFPDSWEFQGSISSQYKQIGNAVPVNLAHAVGRSIIDLLNVIEHNFILENKQAELFDEPIKLEAVN